MKHPKTLPLQSRIVTKYAIKALRHFGYNEKDVELSIIFMGRKKAKDLNIKYRQKDYTPQVLGFPMSKAVDVDGLIHLGDIVICTQKLKYESVFLKKNMEEVLAEWLVHGVENLLK